MLGNDPTLPGVPTVATAAPPKGRSLKWLWITLAVVGALVVVGGGLGAYALISFGAPAAAASQFCADLKAQNYDSAYNLLSAHLRSQYNSDQFRQGSTALDAAEGKVTACGAATTSGAYQYSLGSNKATVTAVITREKQGNLQGGVHLVSESGGWKVDAIDTGALGINFGALQTLGAFCTDLQAANYTQAYSFIGGALQTQLTQALFVAAMQAHDQIDGKVTACTLSAVPATGNTDTAAIATTTITRSTLGAATGSVTLDGTGGTWKIVNIDQSAQGTDLGPLQTGMEFCAALDSGNYAAAYALFTVEFQAAVTEAKFQAALTPPTGFAWGACTADYTTYKVTGTTASYSGTIDITYQGVTVPDKITMNFVQEGGVWKIESFS